MLRGERGQDRPCSPCRKARLFRCRSITGMFLIRSVPRNHHSAQRVASSFVPLSEGTDRHQAPYAGEHFPEIWQLSQAVKSWKCATQLFREGKILLKLWQLQYNTQESKTHLPSLPQIPYASNSLVSVCATSSLPSSSPPLSALWFWLWPTGAKSKDGWLTFFLKTCPAEN